jgi:uncharacterized protein (DUF1800 family)
MGEGAVEFAARRALAEGLRARRLDVGWAVATVLRSRLFFAEANLGRRVASPVEFVVGAVRALEVFDPPPGTLLLAEWCTRLGQDLFYPPNVGGWPRGRGWLSTRALVGRANFAAALVEGIGRSDQLDALALAGRHGRARDREGVASLVAEILQGTSTDRDRTAPLAAIPGTEADAARRIVAQLLAIPVPQ